jgi:hypothetical protein
MYRLMPEPRANPTPMKTVIMDEAVSFSWDSTTLGAQIAVIFARYPFDNAHMNKIRMYW